MLRPNTPYYHTVSHAFKVSADESLGSHKTIVLVRWGVLTKRPENATRTVTELIDPVAKKWWDSDQNRFDFNY